MIILVIKWLLGTLKMHHITPLKYQIAISVYALLPVVYKRRDVMNASALSYSVGFAIETTENELQVILRNLHRFPIMHHREK